MSWESKRAGGVRDLLGALRLEHGIGDYRACAPRPSGERHHRARRTGRSCRPRPPRGRQSAQPRIWLARRSSPIDDDRRSATLLPQLRAPRCSDSFILSVTSCPVTRMLPQAVWREANQPFVRRTRALGECGRFAKTAMLLYTALGVAARKEVSDARILQYPTPRRFRQDR